MKFLLLYIVVSLTLANSVFAVTDPLSVPNNKVGINILSPESEILKASELVNTNGDWGYVVIVIKRSERDHQRWQKTFFDLNKNHLIPIVRLTTDVDSQGYWQRPNDNDAEQWAEFLNNLYWPTKNRYVQIYNEVNHSAEWGNQVDAANYAKELEKTLTALKAKNSDFFVLNAPLDLALATSDNSLDASVFFQTMETTVPGIFNKLDGWASHSYPNPDFSGSAKDRGRTSIAGYKWELSQIKSLGTSKDLSVFITETSWKQGKNGEPGLAESQIAQNYKIAFENVWNDNRIAVVAPFLLNYNEPLFDAFSFRANDQSRRPYEFFTTIKDLPKVKGEPKREDIAKILNLNLPTSVIKNSPARIKFEVKNAGNHIWNTKDGLEVETVGDGIETEETKYSKVEIFPGESTQVEIKITTITEGSLPYSLKIINSDQILKEESAAVDSKTYINFILSLIAFAFN